MSKGKKGNKATPEAVSWDDGLVNAPIEEDEWRPRLVFMCPSTLNDEPHIQALASAVTAGSRRRFSLIDRATMLQSAAEDVKIAQAAASGGGTGKKSKAGAAPPIQKPMFVEVCEQVVDQLKSGNPLPPSLLAKMIKYKVLRHKAAYQAAIAQKEAEEVAKKQAAEKGDGKGGKGGKGDGKGGKGGKGGGSKPGKKGKETPAADADPAIPLPEKPPTSMRKRGEEDLDSKYIDDEPPDGPTCYLIMTGFTSLDILGQLAPVGLTAHVLINIEGGSEILDTLSSDGEIDEERRRVIEEQKCVLIQFWQGLDKCVQSTKDGHMLRNMAQIKLTVPHPLVPDSSEEKELHGQSMFDAVSQSVYHVLEQRTQYQHYLSYLNLRQLSVPRPTATTASPVTDISSQSPLPTQDIAAESPAAVEEQARVDLRLYNSMLSVVPQNSITIPLMLHCMKEQVRAALAGNESDETSVPTSQPPLHSDVVAEITNSIAGLCIPTKTKNSLLPSSDERVPNSDNKRVTTYIEHWDQLQLLSHHLSNSIFLNIGSSQVETNNRSLLGEILSVPLVSADEQNDHLAMLHALQHYCTSAEVSAELLNHALLVLSLEHVQLLNATHSPDITINSDPLLFDFPLDIAIREKSTQQSTASVALVPYNNPQSGTTSVQSNGGDSLQQKYDLDLPKPYRSLSEYTVCEPMSRGSLLQLLQSLQHTHSHLSVHHHKVSRSTLIVAHAGFDGKPLHSYSWQSLAHSRVGFNNYLQYIAQQFGEEIDRAVEEDQLRREVFEEQRCKLMDERRREQEEQQKTMEPVKEEQGETKVSAKGGKKSAASSAKKTPLEKKSKSDITSTTPEPAAEADLPEFEERTLYEAYDVGDTILLEKGQCSVQFLSDGSQIHTERTERFGSDTMVSVSALSNGHMVSCSVRRRETTANCHSADKERKNEEDDENSNKEDETPVASIPQPPLGVEFASLSAQFRDSLCVSLSHFGPNGNGTLPFEPPKPAILLEPQSPDTSSSDSRPQSRQTPQKMNKKQMEQQQQLLEQQRQLEEQKRKERAEAQELYDRQYSALLRQNKYQQLFVSTPYGLHVHCQVDVELSADPALTDGSDGSIIVKQSYPIQSHNSGQGDFSWAFTAYSEVERYYLPDGSVIRFMKDGSIAVLCPDGHVYQTATKSLCDLYHQSLNDRDTSEGAHEEAGEEEVNTPPVQPTFSDTKVSFVDQLTIPTVQERNISDVVWVVMSPTGQRYMWKRPIVDNRKNEADNEESEGVIAKGDGEILPDNCQVPDSQTLPQPSIVPLPSAQVFETTDPVTKQVMINREDNVTMLKSPDGSFVAEHADGTRITTTVHPKDPSLPLEVMAECPGFSRVTHTASKQCFIHFPDGSKVVASTTGHYCIENGEEYKLEIRSRGDCHCVLQPAQSTAYTFTLDHTRGSNILVAKNKQSRVEYSVSHDGIPAVSHDEMIPPHPAFLPRYFIVPSTGDPCQILSQTEMTSFLTAAETQPNTTTVVKGVPVPGFEGATVSVMKALRSEMPAILPYKHGSIVPKNLSLNPGRKSNPNTANGKRRFGVGVGKSLSILTNTNEKTVPQKEIPTALQCRQFVSFEQFNELSRQRIREGLAAYVASRQQQQTAHNDLLPVDLRDATERKAAQALKSEWLTKVSGDIVRLALRDVHQQNAQVMDPDIPDKEPSKIKPADVLKQDLEQAELDQQALRNHTVPLYFDSEKGKQFLRSQSPDMNQLALQLARPKPPYAAQHNSTLSEASHSSTPSTLQSASIILQPVNGDSPDVGEVDTVSVSSVSKVRPAHPTPDHARGLHTPTDVRPTNPTPSHANRLHSPAASLASQPNTLKLPIRGGVPGTDIDISALESDSAAERSVSFMLPPRPHNLGVGESSPNEQKGKTRTSKLRKSKGGNTKSKPNTKFGEIEDTVRRKICTSSTMTGGLVRGFEVQPQALEFGIVQEGCTYARTLTLKNVGTDPCRFRVKQPPPSTGIKIIYTPGPVAAGMSRQIEVEMFAIAVGAVGSSGTGFIKHDLEIISEANILQIPVRATVLTHSEYEARQDGPNFAPSAAGVRRIKRPSSREDFTRPQKPSGMAET